MNSFSPNDKLFSCKIWSKLKYRMWKWKETYNIGTERGGQGTISLHILPRSCSSVNPEITSVNTSPFVKASSFSPHYYVFYTSTSYARAITLLYTLNRTFELQYRILNIIILRARKRPDNCRPYFRHTGFVFLKA